MKVKLVVHQLEERTRVHVVCGKRGAQACCVAWEPGRVWVEVIGWGRQKAVVYYFTPRAKSRGGSPWVKRGTEDEGAALGFWTNPRPANTATVVEKREREGKREEAQR